MYVCEEYEVHVQNSKTTPSVKFEAILRACIYVCVSTMYMYMYVGLRACAYARISIMSTLTVTETEI